MCYITFNDLINWEIRHRDDAIRFLLNAHMNKVSNDIAQRVAQCSNSDSTMLREIILTQTTATTATIMMKISQDGIKSMAELSRSNEQFMREEKDFDPINLDLFLEKTDDFNGEIVSFTETRQTITLICQFDLEKVVPLDKYDRMSVKHWQEQIAKEQV